MTAKRNVFAAAASARSSRLIWKCRELHLHESREDIKIVSVPSDAPVLLLAAGTSRGLS